MAQSEAQKMLDDLRKEYEAREEAESGTPIIKDGKEIIRTTGGIVYGWYCDGRPCKDGAVRPSRPSTKKEGR